MRKTSVLLILILGLALSACTSIEKFEPTIIAEVESGIAAGVQGTIESFTQVPTHTAFPTQTPYATYTAYPTLTSLPTYTPEIIIVTATFTATPLYTPTASLVPTSTATQTATLDPRTEDKGDGFYLVDTDIAPGVWRSDGTQDDCYWEITDKYGGIMTNHFGMAGGTMYVPVSAYQVMMEDCGMWTYLGE